MAQMYRCHYNIIGNKERNPDAQIERFEEITSIYFCKFQSVFNVQNYVKVC